MTSQLELFQPPPDSSVLVAQIKDAINGIMGENRNPSASELLRELERHLGWYVRLLFKNVVVEMRTDSSVAKYRRDYLSTALSDEEILFAMREGTKPTPQENSTLDELFRNSILYRDSEKFKDALEFSAKFREYAPYNNLLVRVQNPSCCYYATAKIWAERFQRYVKEDARPMLILAPMHPVLLVFDLDQTGGPDLPEYFTDFAKVEGDFDNAWLHRTIENAERMLISVQRRPLSQLQGGFVTTRMYGSKYKMRIVLHEDLADPQAYAVLCHELGHVLLGHLGTDPDHWWPCRIGLTRSAVEVEAESVSFMVATRLGLETASASI